MHFGLYLKNKGIISAEQLVAAAEVQLTKLTRIGQLALEEGIISPRDIFEVLHAQSASPNQRFGEVAIELGLMTRDQLVRLLTIQADRKRPIAEILVAQGVLTQSQADEQMSQYRQALERRRVGNAVPSRVLAALRRQRAASRALDVTAVV